MMGNHVIYSYTENTNAIIVVIVLLKQIYTVKRNRVELEMKKVYSETREAAHTYRYTSERLIYCPD